MDLSHMRTYDRDGAIQSEQRTTCTRDEGKRASKTLIYSKTSDCFRLSVDVLNARFVARTINSN